MTSTQNPFSNFIQEALREITAYQWGNAVPKLADQFAADLKQEMKSYAIDFPDSVLGSDGALAQSAIDTYNQFYASLLKRVKSEPEPMNPTLEFDAWWNANR